MFFEIEKPESGFRAIKSLESGLRAIESLESGVRAIRLLESVFGAIETPQFCRRVIAWNLDPGQLNHRHFVVVSLFSENEIMHTK